MDKPGARQDHVEVRLCALVVAALFLVEYLGKKKSCRSAAQFLLGARHVRSCSCMCKCMM